MEFKDFLNYDINESGNSASPVTWRTDNGNKIGEFTVKSSKGTASYYIVVSHRKRYGSKPIKGIEVLEFKFYDSEGSIELKNNMEFVLGVGPTIKKEFEKIMETQPEAVIFSADKHEKSRAKHYDRFTKRISEDYGYIPFYKTAITSSDDEYVLVRPDKIKEFKENFKTTNITQE